MNVFFISEPGSTPTPNSIRNMLNEIDKNLGLEDRVNSITGALYNNPLELAAKVSDQDMLVVINKNGAGFCVFSGKYNLRIARKALHKAANSHIASHTALLELNA